MTDITYDEYTRWASSIGIDAFSREAWESCSPGHRCMIGRQVRRHLASLPCISCGGPSDHRTPDGYPVCSDCHGGES